jgi:hypothetical protein
MVHHVWGSSRSLLGCCCRCRLFPPFAGIRQVSVQLAAKLAAAMVRLGLGREPSGFDGDWGHYMQSSMWPGAGRCQPG